MQELVKDAKELIWLHLTGIFAEVLYCLQELGGHRKGDGFTTAQGRTMFYPPCDFLQGTHYVFEIRGGLLLEVQGFEDLVNPDVTGCRLQRGPEAGARAKIKAKCVCRLWNEASLTH